MSCDLSNLLPHLRQFSCLIHENPQVYFSKDLEFLRLTIEQITEQDSPQESQDTKQECQDTKQEIEASSDEEEGLPPEESFDYPTSIAKAKECIKNKSYEEALHILNKILTKHSNSATATRLRSKVYWATNKPVDAYRDMCVAQQIDYDEEYHSMHMKMKKAVESKKDETPEIIPETVPKTVPGTSNNMEDLMKNFNPENLQAMLQNPALVNMAQSMMQDPQAMQNMMKMFNKS
jgi:hypothetical protein